VKTTRSSKITLAAGVSLAVGSLMAATLLMRDSDAGLSDTAASRLAAGSAEDETYEIDATYEEYFVYGAYLSSEQQPADEMDFPQSMIPEDLHLKISNLSEPRYDRTEYTAEARLSFNKELTRVRIDLDFRNYRAISQIRDFHIHCGPSFALGPSFVIFRDIMGGWLFEFEKLFGTDKVARLVLDYTDLGWNDFGGQNKDSCPTFQTTPWTRKPNILAMYEMARAGLLYFNVHTEIENIVGDIRGQVFEYGAGTPHLVSECEDNEYIMFGDGQAAITKPESVRFAQSC